MSAATVEAVARAMVAAFYTEDWHPTLEEEDPAIRAQWLKAARAAIQAYEAQT